MGLNEKQQKAVFDLPGNTIVTASPGSGKTRTLVARAAYKLDKLTKYKSLALITYTNVAADEISSRLVTDKNVFIGTIHSFCLEYILRPFGWIYNWNRPRVVSYEQLVEFFEQNEYINLEENFGQNKFDEIGKIKKKLDGSLDTEIEWNHTYELSEVADIYFDYLNELNVIDFNEILYRSYKLINQNHFIAKSISSMFYEILVDEFQDTNIYQYEILKIINNHGECTFFMVGDEKQKIFSFAGAIDNSFENAENDFSSENEELSETYRSTDNIVNTYSKLFDDHPEIDNRSDYSNLDIQVQYFETQRNNHLQKIDSIIDFLIDDADISLPEIAILSTSWYSAYPVSKALRQKHRIVGLGALPHKSVNNSTIGLLKALSRYYVSPSLRGLRSIKRNVDLHLLENGIQWNDTILNMKINSLIIKFINLPTEENVSVGFTHFKQLFDSIFAANHSTFKELNEIIKEDEKPSWTTKGYIETLAGVDGITSNTIHKAKGLEFDAVILNEMNENRIPYQKLLDRSTWTYEELTEEGLENGRKLFYVAISRARKYLIILHNWKPSLFINMIKN
ncbi:MAG: ATP-dependent helicase [Bacteroidales bacterium]|nr:ATP-dependent helicase [Bacteroidales bacterium]